MGPLLQTVRAWAWRIKRDVMTLWFARRDPRTPWHAKALVVFVVAYALSPIDLIPDFIPVLGFVDDAILLPLLIWAAVRLLPPDVLERCRQQAQARMAEKAAQPRSVAGAVGVVLFWLVTFAVLAWVALRLG